MACETRLQYVKVHCCAAKIVSVGPSRKLTFVVFLLYFAYCTIALGLNELY